MKTKTLMFCFCILLLSQTLLAQAPVISGFSPASGAIGTTVIISGSNFDATAANNVVRFGAVAATVSLASTSSLTVTVPACATYQPITITNLTTHLTSFPNKPFLVTFAGGPGFTTASFDTHVDFTAGTAPIGVAVGDLDGDGKPDMAITNSGPSTANPSTVSIFRNTSTVGVAFTSGSFTTHTDITVGKSPQGVFFADLDGDGKLDMVVANASSQTISLFRNISTLGNIAFDTKLDLAVTGGISAPGTIVIADLDGDGKPEIIVSSSGTSYVAIFRNTSTAGVSFTSGSFAANVNFTTASTPNVVVVGDLDGDGKPDLAVTCLTSGGKISVLRNTSSAGGFTASSFDTHVDYATAGFSQGLAMGDLDGDGKMDLVAGNLTASNVSVLRNTSTTGVAFTAGSFAAFVNYTVGAAPTSVAISDLDGDGKPDIAVTNNTNSASGNSVSVLKNTITSSGTFSAGSFATHIDYATGINPKGLFISDMDGDGRPDLIVADALNGTGGNVVSVIRNLLTPPLTTGAISPLTYCAGATVSVPFTSVGTFVSGNTYTAQLSSSGGSFSSPTSLTPTLSSTANSGTISAVIPSGTATGSGYRIRVVSTNPAFNGTDNGSDITINALPSAPVATTGTAATSSQITANWNTVSGATGYFLDVSTDVAFGAGNFVSGYNNFNAGNVLTENVTGLAANTTYYYRVRATNGSCTSANANTITYATIVGTCPFVGGVITTPKVIICSGGTAALTVTGSTGNNYTWQISTDNAAWSDISGATNTTYTTAGSDGNSNKFYRLLSKSIACWDVASTSAEVDISNPAITVTATGIADNNITLNWSPVGSGNYNITYSGATSGLQTGVTPPKTITGLTANGGYNFVVTQTGVTGSCSATGTLNVNTLCAVPTNLTATPTTAGTTQELTVSWNGPAGNYRVFYRPLYSYVTFFTKDVTNATSVVLSKQGNNNLYGSNTYQVYVSGLDCPNPGNLGQPTSSIYVTTNPTSVAGCASPTIDTVFSSCPVLLEVQLHGGPGTYNVYIQRLTPTLQAVNSYGVSGGDFVINAAAGQQYLVSADSRCGSVVSTLNIWHNTLTVKPTCSSPANLVLSNPTCNGFTASWNADQCISNTVSGYDLYMRQVGSINYNSYGVPLSVAPVGPHELVNWLGAGKNMQVFVQSIYNCGGSVTYGPSSQTVTITTASAGCRDEEPTDLQQENKPAVQQYSADNQEVFSLYPNPNTGEFTVDLSRLSNNTDEVRIEMLNMIGQTIITHITSISNGHMSEFINLPKGTAAGTYIVRLTAGKNVYTAKVNVSK